MIPRVCLEFRRSKPHGARVRIRRHRCIGIVATLYRSSSGLVSKFTQSAIYAREPCENTWSAMRSCIHVGRGELGLLGCRA